MPKAAANGAPFFIQDRMLMKLHRTRTVLALLLLLLLLCASRNLRAQTPASHAAHVLSVNGDHFELDGKPFQIITGATGCARRVPWA
jgi:hypothetical protein